MSGKLTLVATPIGNLGDLSPRTAEALALAEFWLCEDKRQSQKLQQHLAIKKPLLVLNEHTSEERMAHYVELIAAGKQTALLTDAGCPSISDPGARMADLCHQAQIQVDAIPGPSAVTTALMLSGFYAQRFAFLGYLPRKDGAIRKELQPFSDSPYTLVVFESALRIDSLLAVISASLGERRYAICRELTKLHQQVHRATLPEVPVASQVPRKGEWTLVVEGKRRNVENLR